MASTGVAGRRLLPRLLHRRLPRRGARRPRQVRARGAPTGPRRARSSSSPTVRGGLSRRWARATGRPGSTSTPARRAVDGIKALVRSTFRPEVIGDIGGFGGLFSFAEPPATSDPVLVSSTDGVGTKALIAQAVGRFDTIGVDLVAMCVDDIVCQGAEPLFFLDYIAVGKLDPDHIEQLVTGVAEGCRTAGCALIGGEMAEHPGAMEPGEFDLVGFAVGVAERDRMITGEHVAPGDVLIGLPSPGLRSNGYSLARRVLLDRAERPLDGPAFEGAHHTLADELLAPSVIYAPAGPRHPGRRRREGGGPHHRRRPPRQPRPGAARGRLGRGRALDVGGAAHLRRDPAPRRRRRRRDGPGVQPRHRHGARRRRRATPSGPSTCCAPTATRPG